MSDTFDMAQNIVGVPSTPSSGSNNTMQAALDIVNQGGNTPRAPSPELTPEQRYYQAARDAVRYNSDRIDGYTPLTPEDYSNPDYIDQALQAAAATQYNQDVKAGDNPSWGEIGQAAAAGAVSTIPAFLGSVAAVSALPTYDLPMRGINTAINGEIPDNLSGMIGAYGQELSEDLNNFLSPQTLNDFNRAQQAQAVAQEGIRQALYEQEEKEDGAFLATLKNWGREAVDSASQMTSSSLALSNTTANAAAQFGLQIATAGIGAKGLATVGKGAANLASKAAKQLRGNSLKAKGVSKLSDKAKERLLRTAYVATTEAGYGIGQATREVNEQSHENLYKNSEMYRNIYNNLIDRGYTPQQAEDSARSAVATRAESLALIPNAASAVLAGALIDKAIHPSASVGGILSSVLSEAAEEGLTGIGQEFGSNVGARLTYDNTQSLTEGLGSGFTESALSAALGTGVLRSPQLAGRTLAAGARKIGGAVNDAREERAEKRQAEADTKFNSAVNSAGTFFSGSGNAPQGAAAAQGEQPQGQDTKGTTNTNNAPNNGEIKPEWKDRFTPGTKLDDSSTLDNTEASLDANGNTEAQRYAKSQDDYIFGSEEELNAFKNVSNEFAALSDEEFNGVATIYQQKNNPKFREELAKQVGPDVANQTIDEVLAEEENDKAKAIFLMKFLNKARTRAKGVTDTARQDYKEWSALEQAGVNSTVLKRAEIIYGSIAMGNEDLKNSAASREKFVNEAAQGNIKQERVNEVLRNAQQLGLTPQQAQTLQFLKNSVGLREKVTKFADKYKNDEDVNPRTVHENIYTQSGKNSESYWSLDKIIDDVANGVNNNDAATVNQALDHIDWLYGSITNKAEAMATGFRNGTSANINYRAYNSNTGEEYDGKAYAGSIPQYEAVIREQNDIADIRDTLINEIRNINPALLGTRNTVPSIRAVKAKDGKYQLFRNKAETKNPVTGSVNVAFSNRTQNNASRNNSSNHVVSSNSGTASNNVHSLKSVVDKLQREVTDPVQDEANYTDAGKHLAYQYSMGKNRAVTYSVKLPDGTAVDAKHPIGAYMAAQLKPSPLRTQFIHAGSTQRLNELTKAFNKGEYNGKPVEKINNVNRAQIMFSVLIAKFNTDSYAKKALLNTGDKRFVSKNTPRGGRRTYNPERTFSNGLTIGDLYAVIRELYRNPEGIVKLNARGNLPTDLNLNDVIAALAQRQNTTLNQTNNSITEPVQETNIQQEQKIEPEVKAEDTPAEPQNQKEVIEFTFANKKTNFLSNFYESKNPITYKGHTYKNAEAAFQAQKVAGHEAEFSQLSGYKAKSLGRKIRMSPQRVAEWNNQRINVMREIIRVKFDANPELKEQLLATSDAELVEAREHGDTFWGVDKTTGRGANNLGKLLMELRDQYRQEAVKQETKQTEEEAIQVITQLIDNQVKARQPIIGNLNNTNELGSNNTIASTEAKLTNDFEQVAKDPEPEKVVTLSNGFKTIIDPTTHLVERERKLASVSKEIKAADGKVTEQVKTKRKGFVNTILNAISLDLFKATEHPNELTSKNAQKIVKVVTDYFDQLSLELEKRGASPELIDYIEEQKNNFLINLDTFGNQMNEWLQNSDFAKFLNEQINSVDAFSSGSRTITDWIINKADSKNSSARPALFARFNENGELEFDDKVNVACFLALTQVINDAVNTDHNQSYEQFQKMLLSLGITEEEFNQLPSEVKEELVTSTPNTDLIENFVRYFNQYMGLSTNGNVSVSYDGNAMMQSLASQALRFATTRNWIKHTPQRFEFKTENGTKVVTWSTNTITKELRNDLNARVNPKLTGYKGKYKSVNVGSPLLLGLFRDVILKTLPKDSDLKKEYYLDEEMPELSTVTKLSSNTEYTQEELTALENMRATKYYLNTEYEAITDKLGAKGLLTLRGANVSPKDEPNYNWKTWASLSGTRNTVESSYTTNKERANAIRLAAERAGTNELYMRSTFQQTVSGRWQETTPMFTQGDKHARQMFTQVHQNIDKSQENWGFKLAVLQGLGFKLPKDKSERSHLERLSAKFDEVEAIAKKYYDLEWTERDEEDTLSLVQEMFKDLEAIGCDPFTNLGLNVMLNMNHWVNAKEKSFISNIYLEHDGSTNGYVNAVYKFSSGSMFSPEELRVLNRGSIYPGLDINRFDYYSKDQEDNYTAVAAEAPKKIEQDIAAETNSTVKQVRVSMLRLLNLLTGHINDKTKGNKDFYANVSTKSDGELSVDIQIGRSMVKTPVTAVGYGQGLVSNARSLFNNIIGNPFYQRLSDALQAGAYNPNDPNQQPGEVFFYKEVRNGELTKEEANTAFMEILNLLDLFYDGRLVKNKETDAYEWKSSGRQPVTHYFFNGQGNKVHKKVADAFRNFRFDFLPRNQYQPEGMGNFIINFRRTFADNVYQAVHELRGQNVENTLTSILTITDAMASTARSMENSFLEEFRATMHREPSRQELNNFRKQNKWLYAYYQGNTNLDLTVSERVHIPEATINSSLTLAQGNKSLYNVVDKKGNQLGTAGTINAVPSHFLSAKPGVRALALMIQGMGDGEMQTYFYAHKQEFLEKYGPYGLTEEIFDQVANRYDGFEGSPELQPIIAAMENEAAYSIIKENPLKGIDRLYSNFRKNMLQLKDTNYDLYEKITDAIYQDGLIKLNNGTEVLKPEIYTLLVDLGKFNVTEDVANKLPSVVLKNQVEEIDLKHRVIQETPSTIAHVSINNHSFKNHPEAKPEEYLQLDNIDTVSASELQQKTAEYLNQKMSELKGEPVKKSTGSVKLAQQTAAVGIQQPSSISINGSNPNPVTGSRRTRIKLDWQAIYGKAITKVFNSKQEGKLFTNIIERNLPSNVEIKIMNRADICREQPNAGMEDTAKKALYTGSEIYIVDEPNLSQAERQAYINHELVHAVLTNKILRISKMSKKDYKTQEDIAAYNAYHDLLSLAQEFTSTDFSNIDDIPTRAKLQSIQAILNQYEDAELVDEFTAYILASSEIRDYLSNTQAKAKTVPVLKNIIQKVIKSLGKLLGFTKAETMNYFTSWYGRTITDAAVLTETELTQEPETDITRYFTSNEDTNLQSVMERFNGVLKANGFLNIALKAPINSPIVKRQVQVLTEGMDRAIQKAAEVGLLPTQDHVLAARYVMAAYAYNMNDKNAAYLNANRLRAYVKDKVGVDNFMELGDDLSMASMKANIFTNSHGLRGVLKDDTVTDLSTPLFMALATVSPDVRAVMKNIDINAKDLAISKTNTVETYNSKFDQHVANITQSFFDSLGSVLSPSNRRLNSVNNTLQAAEMFAEDMTNLKINASAMKAPSPLMTKGEEFTKLAINKGVNALKDSAFLRAVSTSKSTTARIVGNFTKAGLKLTAAGLTNGESISSDIHRGLAAEAAAQDNTNSFIRKKYAGLLLEFTREILHADKLADIIQGYEKKAKEVVAQARSDFREVVPDEIKRMFRKEGYKLDKQNSKAINEVLLKTDLASLSNDQLRDILSGSNNNVEAQKRHYEALFAKTLTPSQLTLVLSKSQQLADYITEGKVGKFLLRNSLSILHYAGYNNADPKQFNDMNEAVDRYITLLALKNTNSEYLDTIREAYATAPNALKYSIDQARQLAKEENQRAINGNMSVLNMTKGYYPKSPTTGANVVVVHKSQKAQMEKFGYVYMQDCGALNNYIYMSNTLNPRAGFTQGALQTVLHCAGGADIYSGYSKDPKVKIFGITSNSLALVRPNDMENLIPVFDLDGKIKGYELSMDSNVVNQVTKYETDFTKNLGNWMGRQFEEDAAEQLNLAFIEKLGELYETDAAKGLTQGYVNLYDIKDPVIQEALGLINPAAREKIREVFPNGKFMVRRDMVDDVIGHRKASVTDFWTGMNSLSPETNKKLIAAFEKVLGKRACYYALNGERLIQAGSSLVRNKIVIVSGSVAMVNLMGNFTQLMIAGVNPLHIVTGSNEMVKELEIYNRGRQKIIQLEMKRNAIVGDAKNNWEAEAAAVDAEINAVRTSWTHMKIWPLLEAGEYSTIADIGDVSDDLLLSTGKFGEYFEKIADHIPEPVKKGTQYITVSKGNPVYRALEKATHYGDFISKAILYHHYLNQGMKPEEALSQIRYEFVNYDMVPGRTREYLENMGLLWFYNFKLRSVRVALSMMKNHPLKALLLSCGVGFLPVDIGTPITDNLISSVLSGKAFSTIGTDMWFTLPEQNIWYQLYQLLFN